MIKDTIVYSLVILGIQRYLELVVIVADAGVGQAVGPGLVALAVDTPRAGAGDGALLDPGGDGETLPGRRHCEHTLLGQLAGDLVWLDPTGQREPLLELFGDIGVATLSLCLVFGQHNQNISLRLYAQLLKIRRGYL